MKRLAQSITQAVVRSNPEYSDLQIRKMQFGLECILGELTKYIVYSLIFLAASSVSYYIVALLVFCLFRSFSGGYHSNSYIACFFTTFFILSVIIFTGKYITVSETILYLSCLASFVLVYLFAPVDHPNKPVIDKKRRKKLKYAGLIYTLAVAGLSILLDNNMKTTAIIAVLAGALLLPLGKLTNEKKEKGE